MGCGHLFQDGAQDTIVRLPENCGSGPFVRVAKHWIADDQSLPSDIAARSSRRDGSSPQVHMLQIDDDFESPSALHGVVSFEIRAQGDLRADAKRRKRQNGSGFETQTATIDQIFTLFNDTLVGCPAFRCCNGPGAEENNHFFGGLQWSTSFTITVSVISRGTMNPASVTSLLFSART